MERLMIREPGQERPRSIIVEPVPVKKPWDLCRLASDRCFCDNPPQFLQDIGCAPE